MGLKGRRLIRVLAFALMLLGLVLSLWGQTVERDSFRELSESERGQLVTHRSSERQRAYALKNSGVGLVIAGPVVWLLASLLLRGKDVAKRSLPPA